MSDHPTVQTGAERERQYAQGWCPGADGCGHYCPNCDNSFRALTPEGEAAIRADERRQVEAEQVEQIAKLKAEIAVDDQIIAARQQILDALPCPVHGPCVPYVLQKIRAWQAGRAEPLVWQNAADIVDLYKRKQSGDAARVLEDVRNLFLLRVRRSSQPAWPAGETERQQLGSRFVSVGPVVLGCMAEDSRAALDGAMERWRAHVEQMRADSGHAPSDPVYAFAYWLFRWSGIVTGVNLDPPQPSSPAVSQEQT